VIDIHVAVELSINFPRNMPKSTLRFEISDGGVAVNKWGIASKKGAENARSMPGFWLPRQIRALEDEIAAVHDGVPPSRLRPRPRRHRDAPIHSRSGISTKPLIKGERHHIHKERTNEPDWSVEQ
jgi:hypothetical protein